MNLDSIVKLTITSQSIQMAQAGFGTPLIVAQTAKDTVRTYTDAFEMLNDGFKPDSSAYLCALKLTSQNPRVGSFKVGCGELNAIYQADSNFYGILLADPTPELNLKTADWAESKRVLFGADVSTIDDSLKKKKFSRTFAVYHSNPKEYAAAALMGKLFPTQPGVATWAFKQLSNVEAGQLSSNQINQLETNNLNYYTSINDVGITLPGKVCSGEYIDTVRGIDWLHARLQERIFLLMLKNQKIPYTDKGVDLVRCEILAQLKEAIFAGVLASQPEPTVSAPKVADISDLDKAKRVLPNVTFSGRLAGAIHALEIQGVVSV